MGCGKVKVSVRHSKVLARPITLVNNGQCTHPLDHGPVGLQGELSLKCQRQLAEQLSHTLALVPLPLQEQETHSFSF